MVQYPQAELLFQSEAIIGESALWRQETQTLCWIDIVKGEVHTYHVPTQEHQYFKTAQAIGAIVPVGTDAFVAAMATGFPLKVPAWYTGPHGEIRSMISLRPP